MFFKLRCCIWFSNRGRKGTQKWVFLLYDQSNKMAITRFYLLLVVVQLLLLLATNLLGVPFENYQRQMATAIWPHFGKAEICSRAGRVLDNKKSRWISKKLKKIYHFFGFWLYQLGVKCVPSQRYSHFLKLIYNWNTLQKTQVSKC